LQGIIGYAGAGFSAIGCENVITLSFRELILAVIFGVVFYFYGAPILRELNPGKDVPLQVETVFLPLDIKKFPVPVERQGSGGALAQIGDALVLMTHEGRFFEVGGEEAVALNIAPPDNGFEEMLDFERDNREYQFAHYYFRYNDIKAHDDLLIVSYTEWVAGLDCYRTSLAAADLSFEDIASIGIAVNDWRVVFSTEPCLKPNKDGRAIQGHMAGGRFQVGSNGLIYLASGDYAQDGNYAPVPVSQDPQQLYGKVLAIDLDTGAARIVSQGHSNMQGIAFDSDGQLWTVEHGRRGGDELNLIREGLDYGWPQVSLGTRYNRLPLPNTLDYGRHPVFEPPVYAWLPSVAVSSLTRLDNFHPAWDGDLLAGSLAGGSLFRIRVIGDNIQFAERIPLGLRIRYVQQHKDMIVLWTDQREVLQLRVGEFDSSYRFAQAKIADLGLREKAAEAVSTALYGCTECHGLGVLPGVAAPPLGEVYRRDIAGVSDFPYSSSLVSIAGIWDRKALFAYLDNPRSVAPGTSMPDPGIDDPEVLNALIDILMALREQAE
jgi:cytochrome c2